MTPPSTHDATKLLAEFAASLTFEQIHVAVIEKLKQLILDTLGVALAATTLGPGCREVVATIRSLGGQPESTVLGHGFKVSAPQAAFANGALVHALNFDPIGKTVGHIGVSCLAAPLAVAEASGNVSGRQFLAGVCAAAEITSRISSAIRNSDQRPKSKMLAGQLLGVFGAAAGAGKILGLTANQMDSAFGLALMQASGSMQIMLDGDPPAKSIYGAFPNQAGVMAALLARDGLAAECAALEGQAGLFETFFPNAYDLEGIADGLGARFLLMETLIKPWPTSLEIHSFIEAAIATHQHDFDPSSIESVEIIGHKRLRPWIEPRDARIRPPNAAAAANSIPYAVAKALCRGNVVLEDFTVKALNDSTTLDVAQKTKCSFDGDVERAIVTVHDTDGNRRHAEISSADAGKRQSDHASVLEKFRDCCRHSVTPLTSPQIENLAATIGHLERLDQIGALVSCGERGAITADAMGHRFE